jgi:hypothetical protein
LKKPVREPIATWWRIKPYEASITPLEVVAFTASFVTVLINQEWDKNKAPRWEERRERSDDTFPTFAEAQAEAVRRESRRIEITKNNLQQYRSALGQWESLKEPQEAAKKEH